MTDVLDSLDPSKDYYFFIKDVFNDYSKYVKQYKIILSSFTKKLIQFQEKFGEPLLDLDKIKSKYRNIKINSIYDMISVVPKIVERMIDNFNFSMNELESVIENLDKILAEKINVEIKDEDELEYDSKKNILMKYYKNIQKNKTFFVNKMGDVEDLIVKYFSSMYKTEKNLPEDKNKKDKDKNDNIITKDQLLLNITEGKKAETQYFSSFTCNENLIKSFNDLSQKSKQKFSNYSLNLTNDLKNIILDVTLIIKNNLSEPLAQIAMFVEQLSDIEKSKFEKIINDSFNINKTFSKPKPYVYKIKILNEPKLINGIRNPKYPIISIEDGYDKMTYVENYASLYTINTLYNNFDLIERDNKFDFNKELDKLKTKEIFQKIISYKNISKKEIKNTGNIKIDKEELTQLKELLNEHCNRVMLLQDLSTFRSKGYILPKDIFDLFTDLFMIMISTIDKDKDYHTAKNVIILSDTYYYLEDGIKHYLQEAIKNHDIFKNNKFWENFIHFIIEKEIVRRIQNDKINGTLIKKDQKESDDMYSAMVFPILMQVADNMINFNCETKKIKEIIKPIIKHYNIKEESIKIIDQIIYKNNCRQSMLLNDEIKLLDINKLSDFYKNYDVFENPDDEINKAEKLEDIFDNPKEEEKKE